MTEFILYKRDGEITNKQTVKKAIGNLTDGRYMVKIESAKKRSNKQNRYLHGVVIPMVFDGLRYAGFDEIRTLEDAKMVIKSLFLKREIASKETGHMIEFIKDTHLLTTLEMMEFIESVIKWAQEYLNISIPYPGEVLTLDI